MLNLKLEELVYVLLTLDIEGKEDCVVNNFVGDAIDVLGVFGELTENVPVVMDCIQFDSEDDKGYYCLSVEKYDDESILVSVVNAVNEKTGKYYAINGNVFVADYISEKFEKDIKSYPHADLGRVLRVNLDWGDNEDNPCEDCNLKESCEKSDREIYTEKDKNSITQSWTDGSSYYSRSFQSSDPKKLDKVAGEWSDFEIKFKSGKK